MDRRSAAESTHDSRTVNTSLLRINAKTLRPFLKVALLSMQEPTPSLFALVLIIGDSSPTLVAPFWSKVEVKRALGASMVELLRFPEASRDSFYEIAQVGGNWEEFVSACLAIPVGMLAAIRESEANVEIPIPIEHARVLASVAPAVEGLRWVNPGAHWVELCASVKHLRNVLAVHDAVLDGGRCTLAGCEVAQ